MSDYIFNCFKEHVTTGPACSLSADATDVLTEWKGRPALSVHRACFRPRPGGFHTRTYCILAHVHIYIENG